MNITDSASWTTPVPLIDDGDPLSNAEFLATAQALANRTAYLREGVRGKGTLLIDIPLHAVSVSSEWIVLVSSNRISYRQNSVAAAGSLRFQLNGHLPRFGKIDSVAIAIAHSSSHSALPATMPAWTLRYTDRVYGSTWPPSSVSVATRTDPSGNVATYDASHKIELTGINHTILPDVDYHLLVTGEAGANSQVTMDFFGITIGLAP